jgi:WS/DGAT/MGAT family acyltransferase
VQIFRPADVPPRRTPEQYAAHVEYLYSVAPYTHRRLVDVPFGLDHPYWIEDPAFDPEFHERFIAVPAPGTDRKLEEIVSRIASRPLDRSRPLWEVYLIEGVDQGRKFALYSKTHHRTIDGASATELAMATMQTNPDLVNHPMPDHPWKPDRVPTTSEMLARGIGATIQRPMKLLGVQRRAGQELARGLRPRSGQPRTYIECPPSSINFVPRHFAPSSTSTSVLTAALHSVDLADGGPRHQGAYDTTVNDVVLAVCGGMLRSWLNEQDRLPARPPTHRHGAGVGAHR